MNYIRFNFDWWVMQSRQRMIVQDNTAQLIGAATRNGDDL